MRLELLVSALILSTALLLTAVAATHLLLPLLLLLLTPALLEIADTAIIEEYVVLVETYAIATIRSITGLLSSVVRVTMVLSWVRRRLAVFLVQWTIIVLGLVNVHQQVLAVHVLIGSTVWRLSAVNIGMNLLWGLTILLSRENALLLSLSYLETIPANLPPISIMVLLLFGLMSLQALLLWP